MIKGMFNVEVASRGGDTGWSAHFEDADNNRYHVWFDPKTYQVKDRWDSTKTLYKNPPSGVQRGDPRHFDTRRLNATNKANAEIVKELLERVKADKLVEKKQADLDAVEAERLFKLEAEARLWLARNAGPELLEALRFARSVIKSGESWTDECERIINGAITKAVTPPQ